MGLIRLNVTLTFLVSPGSYELSYRHAVLVRSTRIIRL